MTDADLKKLIALAMMDAQIEAAESGEHDALEELDALAELARHPATARQALSRAKDEDDDGPA